MKRLRYGIIFCVALSLISSGVFAMGVSPYLPLNMSPDIERKIERLLIVAGRPVMTRPIALATVLEALSDARKADEALCDEVERYLERYIPDTGLTQLRMELALDSGKSKQVLPNHYGEKVDSSWGASGAAYLRLGDYISFNLGGVAYKGRTNPTGTMVSLGIDYAQLDIGYRQHWLSPFTDSSMLISTEAPTMPSVTLSNYRPISPLNITYELYLAKMSKSDHIAYQNGFITGNPRLGGVHLQIEPVSGFGFGVNRQLQFGGGKRPGGFRDFINALRDPGKYDNAGIYVNRDQEFGNEQASITSRTVFPGKRPFAVYFELAGEDASFRKDYLPRMGHISLSAGIDIPSLWDRFDLTYETTSHQDAWYGHHIYRDGLTNYGVVLGNWFGDEQRLNDGVKGTSHMLRLGWEADNGDYLQGIYRTLNNDSSENFKYKRMNELGLNYYHVWKGQNIGAGIFSGRDVYGDRYARLSASIDFMQERSGGSSGFISETGNTNDATDFFVDMGSVYSYSITRYDFVKTETPNLPVHRSNGAHFGIGARRPVSEHNDLGVRVEWDRVAGYDLLSARLIDYRYRIGNHFSFGGFFGVSKFDPGVQPYGYYLGAGSQFRNILPQWDLNVDWRSSTNMEHDYTVRAFSVYLSRSF